MVHPIRFPALPPPPGACSPTSCRTGLTLEQYDEELSELMRRLVVAPAASKYLFWRKVQTLQQLRQR